MKKVILTILLVLLGAAAVAGAGFTGYQMGYRHGAATSLNNDEKSFGRFHHFGKDGNPMREFHQFSPASSARLVPAVSEYHIMAGVSGLYRRSLSL